MTEIYVWYLKLFLYIVTIIGASSVNVVLVTDSPTLSDSQSHWENIPANGPYLLRVIAEGFGINVNVAISSANLWNCKYQNGSFQSEADAGIATVEAIL